MRRIDTNDTIDSAADTAEPRSRNRRSPRHLRAAGQKRKKEQTETADNSDDVVVAPSLAADEVVEDVVTATAATEATTPAAVPAEVTATEANVSEAETDVVADKPKTRSRRKPAKKADVAEPAQAEVATSEAETGVADTAAAKADKAVETQPSAEAQSVSQAKPVVAEAVVVAEQAEFAEPVKAAAAKPAAVEVTAAAPAKSRFAQMVVATMTKPELPQADDTAQVTAPVMPTEARPQVASSERPAGSAFARQAASAPMTKPKSAE